MSIQNYCLSLSLSCSLSPPLLGAISQALLDYIFMCCQVRYGGLRDKPGRGRDYYHTCYCLSGLSVANAEPPNDTPTSAEVPPAHWRTALGLTNPVYNISASKVEAGLAYYKALPPL